MCSTQNSIAALNKVAIPDWSREMYGSPDIYRLCRPIRKLCRQYLAYLLLSEGFCNYAIKAF